MIVPMKAYYKVIVLKIDAFESQIIDERHFEDLEQAECFTKQLSLDGCYSLIIEM